MNNFKRFLALMLVLCMGLCLCACGGADTTTGNTQGTEPTGTNGTTQSTAPSQTTESTSDGKVEYKVTVVYPDGTPVAGAYVQICLDSLCYTPDVTNADGVVTFRLTEQEGYKTKLAMAVEGYVWADYIYFDEGSTEITITLVAEG